MKKIALFAIISILSFSIFSSERLDRKRKERERSPGAMVEAAVLHALSRIEPNVYNVGSSELMERVQKLIKRNAPIQLRNAEGNCYIPPYYIPSGVISASIGLQDMTGSINNIDEDAALLEDEAYGIKPDTIEIVDQLIKGVKKDAKEMPESKVVAIVCLMNRWGIDFKYLKNLINVDFLKLIEYIVNNENVTMDIQALDGLSTLYRIPQMQIHDTACGSGLLVYKDDEFHIFYKNGQLSINPLKNKIKEWNSACASYNIGNQLIAVHRYSDEPVFSLYFEKKCLIIDLANNKSVDCRFSLGCNPMCVTLSGQSKALYGNFDGLYLIDDRTGSLLYRGKFERDGCIYSGADKVVFTDKKNSEVLCFDSANEQVKKILDIDFDQEEIRIIQARGNTLIGYITGKINKYYKLVKFDLATDQNSLLLQSPSMNSIFYQARNNSLLTDKYLIFFERSHNSCICRIDLQSGNVEYKNDESIKDKCFIKLLPIDDNTFVFYTNKKIYKCDIDTFTHEELASFEGEGDIRLACQLDSENIVIYKNKLLRGNDYALYCLNINNKNLISTSIDNIGTSTEINSMKFYKNEKQGTSWLLFENKDKRDSMVVLVDISGLISLKELYKKMENDVLVPAATSANSLS